MFRRTVMAAGLLGAAAGGPYVYKQWPQLKASVFGAENKTGGQYNPASTYTTSYPTYSPSGVPMSGSDPQSDQTPLVDLPDAFRWEATPQWVMSRWPRVSAGLPAEALQGMRVTLISGLRMDDVAGSLTYYFNSSGRLAKLTFSGTTGDPSRLTALLVERYGFKPYLSSEPGMIRYEIRWNGDATSTMIIRPASIVRTSSPYEKYQMLVSISDPAVK
jgi:hypothetical protein